MPFIPPNPRLDLLPPEDRERAYREQRKLLEELAGEYRLTWMVLIAPVAAAAIAAVAMLAARLNK